MEDGGGQDKQLDQDQEEMLWEEEQLPNQKHTIHDTEEGERSDCVGSASKMDSSTVEAILEENRKLKAANGELTEENKELKKTLKLTRRVLGTNWNTKMAEFQRKKEVRETLKGLQEMLLNDMLIEEERLKAVIVNLNNSVGPLSRIVRKKDEEVRKLTMRVVKLKEGSAKNLISLKDDTKDTERAARKDAVDVFPEEVWRMILGQVSDPKYLWNLTNTCQLFDDILHEWKMGFMLGQALPHLYRHLPTNVLLGFRAVSKGWNAVVDNFLEDHPSLRPHNEESADPRNLNFVCPLKEKRIATRNYFRFCNEEMFDLETSNMPVAPGRNPFVGRYVTFNLGRNMNDAEEEDGTEELWWDRLYQFLEAYGKEIWHLTVELPAYPETPLMVRKVTEFSTVKMFQFLPNLRKLSMCDFMLFWGDDEDEDVHIDPSSIPDTPKLESIYHNPEYEDFVLLEAYLRRFHVQLRHLVTVPNVWNRVRHLDWPNLTELELQVNFSHGDLHLLHGVNMPLLTKLILTLATDKGFTYEKLSEVVIEVASTTSLNTLRLSLNGSFAYRGRGQDRPKALPTKMCYLKNLEMENYCKPLSFNFVLWCFPALENLNVFYSEDFLGTGFETYLPETSLKSMDDCRKEMTSPEQNELIDINKYVHDREVYKSNIWELLPLLKVFTFQWDVYTREGYEAYLRSREQGRGPFNV